ncbi:hypothetical protein [Sphingobacterium sp. CZ-2]|uniref:hypothetical protein n=1 Tax=Sphingobacterium sp. CZ-2 TaxID=2557994 RepID=UPI0010704583|nr:hypothetical protein [Sphingobacterium sp. CZ-2]QBR11220.1 hypothetical protein E3D81_03130 [Sphingobacterium sp. CZ-2]
MNTFKLLSCFLLFILLIGCDKGIEKENPNPIEPPKEASIEFNIDGLEDTEDVFPEFKNEQKASANHNRTIKPVSFRSDVLSLNGFDVIMEITEKLPAQFPGASSNKKIQSSTKSSFNGNNQAIRYHSPLNNGVKYRIVLYKTNGSGVATTYAGQQEGTIGSNYISIGANRNTQYRWYAYTYNNTSPIDTFVVANGTVPVKPSANSTTKKQDFAYATGLITTSNVVNGLNSIQNIVLTRKTARFVVEVNSRGMFAPVTYASLRIKDNAGFMKGNFRLSDSSYLNLTNVQTTDQVYNHNSSAYVVPVGTDTVPELNWKKRYTFYSPVNSVSKPLTISIDTMRITSKRLRDTDGAATDVVRTFTNNEFVFNSFIAQPGKSYFVSIILVESAIPMGSARWARGNTWRVADGPLRPDGFWDYRIRYDNPLYQTVAGVPTTDYFTHDIYSVANGKNICEMIYPEDTWTLPTPAHFNSFNNITQNVGVEYNGWYLYMTPTTPVLGYPSYPHGDLIFTPVGYKQSSTGPTNNFFPNSTSYQNTKGYWRTTTSGTFARLNYNNTSWFNDRWDETNSFTFSSSNLASVRCVRK